MVVKTHTWNLPCMVCSQTWHPLNFLQETTETASAAPSRFFESLNLPTQKNATSRAENRWGNFSYLAMLQMATANFRKAGPCMDLSVHVPNGYLKVVFNWLLSWKQIARFPMDPNTVYVLESRLISMDGAIQILMLEFEASRWHNSRVCVWYFQVCKSQSFLHSTGQILDLGK